MTAATFIRACFWPRLDRRERGRLLDAGQDRRVPERRKVLSPPRLPQAARPRDAPPRGESGRNPGEDGNGIRAGPPFTPIVGGRRLTFEAGSHDPASGRSGGRGDPSPAPSHPTAPS
jgi:hypothetical protein